MNNSPIWVSGYSSVKMPLIFQSITNEPKSIPAASWPHTARTLCHLPLLLEWCSKIIPKVSHMVRQPAWVRGGEGKEQPWKITGRRSTGKQAASGTFMWYTSPFIKWMPGHREDTTAARCISQPHVTAHSERCSTSEKRVQAPGWVTGGSLGWPGAGNAGTEKCLFKNILKSTIWKRSGKADHSSLNWTEAHFAFRDTLKTSRGVVWSAMQ